MLIEIFRIGAITSLIIVAMQLLKVARDNKNSWIAIAFSLSVACYLIVDRKGEINSILFSILLIGPFLLPVFFWLLSKSIFDDHFRIRVPFFIFTFTFLILQYIAFYYESITNIPAGTKNLILLVPKLISFVLMFIGVLEAVRNRKYDLIDARLRFRNIFIIVTASLIAITLIAEIIGLISIIPEILSILQKGTILILTILFIFDNFRLKPGFFLQPDKQEKSETERENYNKTAEKIRRILADEKIYRTEGLTIGRLAEMLKEQEYRVRRTINGEMGFRNFNDFLNKYRVQEACTILQDPEKNDLTILEIAYSLGYQSIGPFNKAFKDLTGLTPTAYRKQRFQ